MLMVVANDKTVFPVLYVSSGIKFLLTASILDSKLSILQAT